MPGKSEAKGRANKRCDAIREHTCARRDEDVVILPVGQHRSLAGKQPPFAEQDGPQMAHSLFRRILSFVVSRLL